MKSLHNYSARALAKLIRSGELSCLKLMQHYLERIQKINPSLNAFCYLIESEKALEAAREADQQRSSGHPLGRLHGLVFSVKDSIHVAGFPRSEGSRNRTGTIDTNTA